MKKLNYLVAILLIAFTFSALSQGINDMKLFQKNLDYTIKPHKPIETSFTSSKSEKSLALTWEQIELCYQPLYFSHYSRCTPIVYDPISNLVIVAGMQSQNSGPQTLSKIMGEVYYKQPTGMRWDSTKLFNEDEMGIANPSITVNNTSGATNYANLSVTMLGRFAPAYNEWRWTGVAYAFKNASEVVAELSEYPDANNPGGQYNWFTLPMVSSGTHSQSYAASILTVGMQSSVQYGAYGFLAMDAASQTSLSSKIPNEWAVSLFRASTDLNSSYNASMEIAVDNSNNVYVAVNNIFADDENNRIPAVSISNNSGDSWSPFNRMPASLLEEYRAVTAYEIIGPYDVYNQKNGFVAWGNNSFSYFFPVFLASQDTIREIHIVEARCMNNSTWSLWNVAELNGFTPWIFYDSDLYPNATDRFRITRANLGYEIQASKTADGQYLIVKWVDQGLNQDGTGKISNFTTPVPITMLDANNEEVDATINSMEILDIFIARRKIDNNNWKVSNVTNDNSSYKAVWIPDIVPAVDNIPIICSSTPVYQGQDPFNNLPLALRDRIIEFPAFFFMYSRITEPMDVEESTNNYNFNVLSVYPNPVTDLVEFTFELKEASNVRIEITNALGQLVKVVYDNYTGEGLQGFNADLSYLSSGVYYYTLTAGNNKATKLLNIVR